ncbi:N-acetylmuramic acid 6-phosphate etherase [Paracoccus sp. Z330]|uniref:N-acetylmuramic acid 6-phosphate etherase n=1 Tax=Paracoccus onchidii TaxID=3017813 RepID=A0ABT4ZF65_9RHOB|nr:N-acetylmuramic acid 6-phosphate etherase [Paracoccus onchidii]MDB6177361.1 N-acetylmuramic acid 6-phosphate etherase [Paracoccus onchidii]
MAAATTEQLHMNAVGLDARPLDVIARQLVRAQCDAANAALDAAREIAIGARLMADTLRNDGVLHYVAAGSSGLMAAADVQELGGTFSIPPNRLRIHMAGGLPDGVEMPGDTEDATDEIERNLQTGPNDTIIAVSASGTTPFTLQAARIARRNGVRLIAIANNPGAPLLQMADVAILLPTPPELVSGSTRLGAATAQKIALNTLSTAMAVELGHVHDGMMVNLHADNAKLRQRAQAMVAHIAAADSESAATALQSADGNVKLAVLMAAHSLSLQAAGARLETARGNLRVALKNHNNK